ncbi:PQQ-binding-like beta-propeller repeat protein [Muricoccus aerilatus]|uniref:outer membrane protein assembly factor BamB family protein n=1 Tax=Muricoccus aerilatus TaxID=452982 RepID=UPI0005C198A4|nr:PQQ-binding-like beta-propeller repeat protein [Roseomonas aerilata]
MTAVEGSTLVTTLDGHLISIEAGCGRVAWDMRAADPDQGETFSSAPLVVGDRVFLGNGGDDNGARGWIEARELATGRPIWRRYSTGPDGEVGYGDRTRDHADPPDACAGKRRKGEPDSNGCP